MESSYCPKINLATKMKKVTNFIPFIPVRADKAVTLAPSSYTVLVNVVGPNTLSAMLEINLI
jgi:hypothetical protein